MSPRTVIFVVGLVLAVGGGVREAWRREVPSAASSLSFALVMAALLVGGQAETVLLALSVPCTLWYWVTRWRGRVTRD